VTLPEGRSTRANDSPRSRSSTPARTHPTGQRDLAHVSAGHRQLGDSRGVLHVGGQLDVRERALGAQRGDRRRAVGSRSRSVATSESGTTVQRRAIEDRELCGGGGAHHHHGGVGVRDHSREVTSCDIEAGSESRMAAWRWARSARTSRPTTSQTRTAGSRGRPRRGTAHRDAVTAGPLDDHVGGARRRAASSGSPARRCPRRPTRERWSDQARRLPTPRRARG